MSAATYTFKAVDATGTPEKGEISGVNTTVGGMVVARLRGLNEVDTIQ